MVWLHQQPARSVVYVAFGSRCAVSHVQLREIAVGLQASGCRFLWIKTTVVDIALELGRGGLAGERGGERGEGEGNDGRRRRAGEGGQGLRGGCQGRRRGRYDTRHTTMLDFVAKLNST
ncbi:hypothetical protein E2562_027715 [Oryza meyeriana var. granulata]|uniref:Uncharacterized protein n=1 Tax=Oryza meyeriana var. granulata TaxID=110450 RepID=A0A6G1CTN1_9ORYZ|nr:hypothetical protein E2562_027715 [Oryza meyeriana var. granulata]